jgi:alpha-ribazole phosphatase
VTRILLCRHAEPEAWAKGRFCGALDVALSDAGRAQADALAAGLSEEQVAAVITSPARRCVETAGPIAAAHGLEARSDAALSEIDFGDLDGRTFAEVETAFPDLYEQWLREPTTVRFPGGETYDELRARVAAALTAIRVEHTGRTVAVVTHAGVIRALLAAWLEIPAEAVFSIDQRYASLNVVDWLDAPVVRLVNGRPGSRP